jgi:hypothetical protein
MTFYDPDFFRCKNCGSRFILLAPLDKFVTTAEKKQTIAFLSHNGQNRYAYCSTVKDCIYYI